MASGRRNKHGARQVRDMINRLHDHFGVSCMSAEDGEKLYALLQPILKNDESVVLDFTGVRFFLTLFFNASLAKLAQDLGTEFVRSHITVEALASTATHHIDRAFRLGARMADDETYRGQVIELANRPLVSA